MRIILFVTFMFTLCFADEGFFKNSFQSKTFSKPSAITAKALSTKNSTVTVTVDANDTINKVYASIFSNNTNGYVGKSILTSDLAKKNLQNANIYAMRLPGGNWSNLWLWDETNHWGTNLKDDYIDKIKSRPSTTWTRTNDEILEICEIAGARPQICVNYSLARHIDSPDAVQEAAHYAAEWVRDVNIKKGLNVEYWEIGNENYGSWQSGYIVDGVKITAEEYGKDFCVFADSMKAADPSIKVGAVVYEAMSGSNVPDWNIGVLKNAKDHMDFLAVHEYFTWSADMNNVTAQQVLDGVPIIGEVKEMLEDAVETYTGKEKGHYPIAMTEYNMRAGVKNHSYLAAVFIAQALGEYIKHGYGLVNIWGSTNGFDNDKKGDHGMLSSKDPEVADYTPQPNFYPYYYYTNFFGDHLIEASSNKDDVKVYASTFATGHVGLVVVNQGSSAETVQINLDNFEIGSNYYMYSMQSDQLTNRGFNINGEVSSTGLNGPDNYDEVKPYSATISGDFKLDLDKFSVNFIIVDPESVTAITDEAAVIEELSLDVYPNPFNPVTTIAFSLPEATKNSSVRVYDIKGNLLQTLHNGSLKSGNHSLSFNGNNLASGIYFVRVNSGTRIISKKMILIK